MRNAKNQRSRLSVTGGTSPATSRPTTALPAHSTGGMVSSAMLRRESRESMRSRDFSRRMPRIRIAFEEDDMTRAIQIQKTGGPEELKLADVSVGDPGPGEIRIRHKAVGLNFIDVYHRTGLYPL